MKATTHQLFAVSAFAAAFPVLAQDLNGLIFQAAAVATGALLPDLDSPHSAFGRRIKPVSLLLNRIFSHRGALHSLIMASVTGVGLTLYTPLQGYGFLIGLGWLSHIVGDLFFTSQSAGVALLWPYPKRFSWGRFTVGGKVEQCFALLLAGLLGVSLYFRVSHAVWDLGLLRLSIS